MIALRRRIERGVQHPLLGPLFLLLLAVLLVFTVIHGAHDQIHSDELIVCVAFLVAAVASLILPRLREVVVVSRRVARGPPAVVFSASPPSARPSASAPVPLRL